MILKITNTQNYSDIADALRLLKGNSNTYLPSEMAEAIKEELLELPPGTRFKSMYYGSSLDLHIYKITNVTDLSNFTSRGDGGFGTLDISNFDFTNVTSWNNMFAGCNNDCNIYVKDQDAKDWIESKFPSLTNVQIKEY